MQITVNTSTKLATQTGRWIFRATEAATVTRTDSGNWPAGTTLDWLREKLGSSFDLVEQRDEPFLIRETARKFQWTVALLTKWRRRQPSGSPP